MGQTEKIFLQSPHSNIVILTLFQQGLGLRSREDDIIQFSDCLKHIYIRAYIADGSNVGSMLIHRLRRWPNIEPTLGRINKYILIS